jgi:hypothetical protein
VWEVDSSSCVYFVEELSELVVLKEDEPEMMQIADANDEVGTIHYDGEDIDNIII